MTETASGTTGRKGKGGRKGLKTKRIFTTAGVHPYDTLDWERRDVVMTNWRDGTVNFEQLVDERHPDRDQQVLPRGGGYP